MYFFKQRWVTHLATGAAIAFAALVVFTVCGLSSGCGNPNPASPVVGVGVMLLPTSVVWYRMRSAPIGACLRAVLVAALISGWLGIKVGSASTRDRFTRAEVSNQVTF